jgi:hypothetical protein
MQTFTNRVNHPIRRAAIGAATCRQLTAGISQGTKVCRRRSTLVTYRGRTSLPIYLPSLSEIIRRALRAVWMDETFLIMG